MKKQLDIYTQTIENIYKLIDGKTMDDNSIDIIKFYLSWIIKENPNFNFKRFEKNVDERLEDLSYSNIMVILGMPIGIVVGVLVPIFTQDMEFVDLIGGIVIAFICIIYTSRHLHIMCSKKRRNSVIKIACEEIR